MFLDDFSPIFDLMDELDGVIKDLYESEVGIAIIGSIEDLAKKGADAIKDAVEGDKDGGTP